MIIKNDIEVKELGFNDSPELRIKQENLHKIYRLLTTSSYKDSIGSICREYAMNALDSNVSAGKLDEPVLVRYNNDNTMSIIDNGLGMSEEFIYDVYMSLGDSTKDADNQAVGGFGIGAKVYFSYDTNYILISRYNGEKKTYLIAENENGLPDATILNIESTEECNGVEIKLGIKNGDFPKFKKALEDQLKYTKNIIIEGFSIPNDYKIIQGRTFVYRPDRQNVDGKLNICWGSVNYPIPFEYLGIPAININCAIYFPQETAFQPEAARENLRNTENNKKLILDKIEEFKQEIIELSKEQIEITEYFQWFNRDKVIIDLEGSKLDVSDLIKNSYKLKMLENTHINPASLRTTWNRGFEMLFLHRRNSRHYSNRWYELNPKNYMYHADKDVNSSRLSKLSWKSVTYKKSINFNKYFLQQFYAESVMTFDKVTNDPICDFDYVAEIKQVQDAIWKEIKERTVDAFSIEFERSKSARRKITNEEVRGKFSDNFSEDNKWRVRKLSEVDKFIHKVVTTDEEEYKAVKSCQIRVAKKGKYVDNFFIAILTTEKHYKKFNDFMTYEEFINSNMLKKIYIEKVKYNAYYNLSCLAEYERLHRMYKYKHEWIRKDLSKERYSYCSIGSSVERSLQKLYPDVRNQFKKAEYALDKLRMEEYDTNKTLRYQILYRFTKNRLNNLKNKVKCKSN